MPRLATSRLGKEQYDHLPALAANSAGLPYPAFRGLRTGSLSNLPQLRSPTDPGTGGICNDNKPIVPDAPERKETDQGIGCAGVKRAAPKSDSSLTCVPKALRAKPQPRSPRRQRPGAATRGLGWYRHCGQIAAVFPAAVAGGLRGSKAVQHSRMPDCPAAAFSSAMQACHL
jgi:hypothetical protein